MTAEAVEGAITTVRIDRGMIHSTETTTDEAGAVVVAADMTDHIEGTIMDHNNKVQVTHHEIILQVRQDHHHNSTTEAMVAMVAAVMLEEATIGRHTLVTVEITSNRIIHRDPITLPHRRPNNMVAMAHRIKHLHTAAMAHRIQLLRMAAMDMDHPRHIVVATEGNAEEGHTIISRVVDGNNLLMSPDAYAIQ